MDLDEHCSTGAAPLWIKPYDFPLEDVPVKPSQVNLQYLLIDSQRNWEEKTFYRHYAVKALTQIGIERISQLNIDFDPSCCQVVVHTIRVFREGQWLDRLESARHNVIQRETELEQNLYNGDLTLVYFLNDIREDDIIEYSYSLVGHHPLFASHYAETVYLQRESSVEKITHRFLGHPDLSFRIQPVGITIDPKIKDLSPSLREWVWEAIETSAYAYETGQPIWHNPPNHIEMSQYKTWGEVVKKISPLFTLPPDFSESIPSEMQTLTKQWKESTRGLKERALLALRFVQDEVRYLGIEEGMGAFKPNDPKATLEHRFGDCKDKTFLLHALLQLMDIPSTPLLVHSSKGKRLPEILPTPFVFNHIVLQVEIDGTMYYLDPTISLQGGSLKTNFFPDYKWGLLLSNNTEALMPLPKIIFNDPTEIDTSFVLESEDFACLKIKSMFYGFRADRVRQLLKWNGLRASSEESLSGLQEVFGAVVEDSPVEVSDDRESNILTLIASYHLPTQKLPDGKIMDIFSYILRTYLHSRVNPERTSPYAIAYPLWVKERIHVENPFIKWKPFRKKYTQEHESLFYSLSTRIEGSSADFNLELKHLQDHIPQTSMRDYWDKVNDIDKNAPSTISIAFPPIPTKKSNRLLMFPIVGLFVWLVLYFLYRKNRSTQDLLNFHLSKFRSFYSVFTIFTVICLGHSPIGVILISFGIILLTGTYCNFIMIKRSIKSVFVLQCFLNLQAFTLTYLTLNIFSIQLVEKILIFAAFWLYLGYCLLALHKSRMLLLKEKNVLNLAP